MIISDGFNGTPSGFDNTAEDKDGKTHWYTLHAEANAILKLAASTQNSIGATLYITCSPCRDCAKLIYQSGIKRVVYGEDYKTSDGTDFLKKAGIEVQKITDIQNNFTDIVDAFELEQKTKIQSCTYKAIYKAHQEEDYDSIDESSEVLMKQYGDNMGLIRTFLVETNSFKDKLKCRNSVYVKAIQICVSSKLDINEFLYNLK